MPEKFDIEAMEERIREKLRRKVAPQAVTNPFLERLMEASQGRGLPQIPRKPRAAIPKLPKQLPKV